MADGGALSNSNARGSITSTPRGIAGVDDTVMRLPLPGGGTWEGTVTAVADVLFRRYEASFMKRIDTQVAQRVDAAFMGLEDRLYQRLSAMVERLVRDIVQPAAEQAQPRPPPQPLQTAEESEVHQMSSLCSALRQAPLVDKKSRYAVVERLPEMDAEGTDTLFIEKVVRETAKEIGDDLEVVRVFRHNGRRTQNTPPTDGRPLRARVVKVEFADVSQRDRFIVGFRRSLAAAERDMRPVIFARRDMIPLELQLQSRLRRQCYQMNMNAGEMRYFYRDLEIRPCKAMEDGSFRTFTARPRSLDVP